ncbi:MAG: DNA polymerase III subunit alpha [Planctomycetes bacterium]|nr:DNA polymerase III subunit alpha [Planctomycetota bacterium]
MSEPDFVHLHVHSEYSLLDGANRIGDLVKACTQDKQHAIALTDHGNMFGAMELYQSASSSGIKPILGCEVYLAKKSRREPHNKKENGYHHLTLLARNERGYKNLLDICSTAYTEGYHFRPRIDKEYLSSHAEGLACLSGCLAGEINQHFLRDEDVKAEELATTFRDLFGKEHFWLELQRNGIDIQAKANEALVRLAQRTAIPLIATNDIHYLRQEDCHAQDVLLCINTQAKRAEKNRFRFDTDTLFFRTRKEMGEIFRDLPHALSATMDVANQVDLKLEFGKYHVPLFHTGTSETPTALLDRLCEEGLLRLYGADPAGVAKARERIEHEKRVIREMGFESYFLIVWDLIRWAREHGIPVGPGRGSAAGSAVAYVLGITQIDPLRYDLLFERFLNSARVSMPDIDIDFCMDGRERVLQYTRDRYGVANVAQIVTFGTMASRTVVRDVGRVLDVPLKDVDRIAKKIPAGPNAPSLEEALENDKDLIAIRKERPEFEELFEFSKKLEGLARHISTHAAGVVISPRPLIEFVPLCTHDGEVATQWPAKQLEDLGLLKMDYLGLRTLTILARALVNIEKRGGTAPDLLHLPEGDPATYRMLIAGDTEGVFQLESDGMKKLLARIKPDCFEDLIAILALYRPGPLESGMIDMFVRRKHGEEAIEYPHPLVEPILKDTYGCIVYQEQVMLIASSLGGFSLNEADNLRKAMGKKKPEIMAKYADQFVSGAVKNGATAHVAQAIWDNIVKFGGYGFNKSHSTAYALITYQTAYLKANHRAAFLAANMSCEMSSTDKVKAFWDDARRAKVEIHGPDLRFSGWTFECEGEGVRYGLGAIKGTGERAIENLLAARDALQKERLPIGMHELCARADSSEVPRLCWEALIKAGALDFGGVNRGMLVHQLDSALAEGSRLAADRKAGQGSLFGGPAEPEPTKHEHGGPNDDAHAWTRAETLRAEREALGFYVSGHPLEERAGLFALLSTVRTSELATRSGGSELTIAGLVVGFTELIVKSGSLAGRKMARFRLEDLEGSVAVTVFPRTLEAQQGRLAEDTVIVARAKLEEHSEEPALILEEALSIDEALKRFDGGLVVELEPTDRERLAELKSAFASSPGKSPVWFLVNGDDGYLRRVRASKDHAVTITPDLAEKVHGLIGRGRLRLARI